MKYLQVKFYVLEEKTQKKHDYKCKPVSEKVCEILELIFLLVRKQLRIVKNLIQKLVYVQETWHSTMRWRLIGNCFIKYIGNINMMKLIIGSICRKKKLSPMYNR